MLGAGYEFKIKTQTKYFQIENIKYPVRNQPELLPDSANIAGTTFSCALIKDDRELHLIPGLELQAILHFFYVEEQFLALTDLICDEAKLGTTKRNVEISIPSLSRTSVSGNKL